MEYQDALTALSGQDVKQIFSGPGKVFIIGPTGVGKSTFARELAKQMGNMGHIEASGWLKDRIKVPEGTPPAERAEMMATRAIERLVAIPNEPARWMQEQMNCAGGGMVVSGIRNPRDFAVIFNPTVDVVISLRRDGIKACTAFERGVEVIEAHARWAADAWAARRENPLPTLMRVNLVLRPTLDEQPTPTPTPTPNVDSGAFPRPR